MGFQAKKANAIFLSPSPRNELLTICKGLRGSVRGIDDKRCCESLTEQSRNIHEVNIVEHTIFNSRSLA